MKTNVFHILEGIKNSIFVKEEVEAIANYRRSICEPCPKNSKNKDMGDLGPYYSEIRPDEHCTICACNLHAKTRSLHTSCPIDKWPAVASKEEQAKIAAALENQNYENDSK